MERTVPLAQGQAEEPVDLASEVHVEEEAHQATEQAEQAEQAETSEPLFERNDALATFLKPLEPAQYPVEVDAEDQPLLSCIIRVSASQWLQDYSWDALQALQWLLNVACQVSARDS